mgnify:CR=1 FL=1
MELGLPKHLSRTELIQLLGERYPQHEWDTVRLLRGRLAQQKRLEKAVRSLFAV